MVLTERCGYKCLKVHWIVECVLGLFVKGCANLSLSVIKLVFGEMGYIAKSNKNLCKYIIVIF